MTDDLAKEIDIALELRADCAPTHNSAQMPHNYEANGDDLPKVITIGRLRFRRRGGHPYWWSAPYPGGDMHWYPGRGWRHSPDQGPDSPGCHPTPLEAYLATLRHGLEVYAARYQSDYSRIVGLLREAGSEENESQKQPIQIQTTEPPQ